MDPVTSIRAQLSDEIFGHIKHGDEAHRKWLKEELSAFLDVSPTLRTLLTALDKAEEDARRGRNQHDHDMQDVGSELADRIEDARVLREAAFSDLPLVEIVLLHAVFADATAKRTPAEIIDAAKVLFGAQAVDDAIAARTTAAPQPDQGRA